jgi:hypothetical protein
VSTSPIPEAATADQRRADALRRAAQAKRQAATTRAENAIRHLVRDKQEINFRSVARSGGVSLDFLYAHTDLRRRIEGLRAQQAAHDRVSAPRTATEDSGDIVHILTAELRKERTERRTAVSELEQQLAAAHGELLRLRRLLQQHGIAP